MRNRIGKENLRYQIGITLGNFCYKETQKKKKNGAGRECGV